MDKWFHENLGVTLMQLLLWIIGSCIGALWGSFGGAYLKKKGENLATHEDIDKLTAQVSAVTAATKQIESKIETEAWARQKKWEIKRDVLFQVTKSIGVVTDALTKLYGFFQSEAQRKAKGEQPRLGLQLETIKEAHRASQDFEAECLLAALICGQELTIKLLALSSVARKIAGEVSAGEAVEFPDWIGDFLQQREAIWKLIRSEMELS